MKLGSNILSTVVFIYYDWHWSEITELWSQLTSYLLSFQLLHWQFSELEIRKSEKPIEHHTVTTGSLVLKASFDRLLQRFFPTLTGHILNM
jgi:hypothetical protein